MWSTLDDAPQVAPSDSPTVIETRNIEKERLQPDIQISPSSVLSSKKDSPAFNRSRQWPWLVAILISAIVALEVGIGIEYAAFADMDRPSRLDAATDTNASTATGTLPAAASSQASSGTPSASDVARHFACNDSVINEEYLYISTSGVKFHKDCYVHYVSGDDRIDGDGVVKDLAEITTYTFESCMDNCAAYSGCGALTYLANLTWALPSCGGKCILKNAPSVGYASDDNIKSNLTGSAWVIK